LPNGKIRIRIQTKQSGYQGVNWDRGKVGWLICWRETSLDPPKQKHKYFTVPNYLKNGAKNWEEAEALALRDAVQFRCELVQAGKIRAWAQHTLQSGVAGVKWRPEKQAWQVELMIKGTKINGGLYEPKDKSQDEIEKARLVAVEKRRELERKYFDVQLIVNEPGPPAKRESGFAGVTWERTFWRARTKGTKPLKSNPKRCRELNKSFAPVDNTPEAIERARQAAIIWLQAHRSQLPDKRPRQGPKEELTEELQEAKEELKEAKEEIDDEMLDKINEHNEDNNAAGTCEAAGDPKAILAKAVGGSDASAETQETHTVLPGAEASKASESDRACAGRDETPEADRVCAERDGTPDVPARIAVEEAAVGGAPEAGMAVDIAAAGAPEVPMAVDVAAGGASEAVEVAAGGAASEAIEVAAGGAASEAVEAAAGGAAAEAMDDASGGWQSLLMAAVEAVEVTAGGASEVVDTAAGGALQAIEAAAGGATSEAVDAESGGSPDVLMAASEAVETAAGGAASRAMDAASGGSPDVLMATSEAVEAAVEAAAAAGGASSEAVDAASGGSPDVLTAVDDPTGGIL